jgi:predicted nuclease of predicted toxin-antitoxin system
MAANGSTSKKRSAANSWSKPPSRTVFFLDRSLGKIDVATALRQAGAQVEVHDDHFPPDARDELWLRRVGENGWAILTKDRKIRYRTIEREALLTSGARVFVLTAGDLRGAEMAAIFVKALPKIERLLKTRQGAFIAVVTQAGGVRVILNPS